MSDLLEKATKLQQAGFSEEEIASMLGLNSDDEPQLQVNTSVASAGYDFPVPEFTFDYSSFSDDAVFQEKPAKPNFFKAKEQLQPFEQQFELESNEEYVLNGETRKVKKLNMLDIMRITAKVPKWAAYIGFKVPQMLVNEYTNQYRWSETILALFERAFGDYDMELDRPTDFALSVIEEIVRLLQLKDKGNKAVDYLLSCDPDEVYVAVAKLISYNQTFFLRIYNSLGPIKDLLSSTFGMISSRARKIKEMNNLENSETNQTQNLESE